MRFQFKIISKNQDLLQRLECYLESKIKEILKNKSKVKQ